MLKRNAAWVLCLMSGLSAGESLAQVPPPQWGFQAEQLEYRVGKNEDVLAWEGGAFFGNDARKFVWQSEAEYGLDEKAFETLENQLRLQLPVSEFFDAYGGVRLSTPEGEANRLHGVVGVTGLTPQWLEVDAGLFLSDKPFVRLEAEYEALITNRLILTPVLELDLPLVDDRHVGAAAWAPTVEGGLRLSYDLVDRAISPYLGIHYERMFGETGQIARREGGGRDALYFVVGTRLTF
ncbi:copper resistance protein B [Aquibaculum sediminis]|uniref:copper resistance protein B n=1 Tax=Aquibaculum sediminis TaxID=3231907 RepID=UPI003452B799